MKQLFLVFSVLSITLLSSCNKEHECVCEGNVVGVNGTWEENQVGYETAKKGCEFYEECVWVEI